LPVPVLVELPVCFPGGVDAVLLPPAVFEGEGDALCVGVAFPRIHVSILGM